MVDKDQEYERERIEQERREDMVDERTFWQNVFLSVLDETSAVPTAIDKADAALTAYRSRFQ